MTLDPGQEIRSRREEAVLEQRHGPSREKWVGTKIYHTENRNCNIDVTCNLLRLTKINGNLYCLLVLERKASLFTLYNLNFAAETTQVLSVSFKAMESCSLGPGLALPCQLWCFDTMVGLIML